MLTAQTIADALHSPIKGNGSSRITGVKPLPIAGPEDLTFFAPTTPTQHKEMLTIAEASKAGAILVKEQINQINATQIITDNPLGALIQIVEKFFPKPKQESGVHPSAVISTSASIGQNVSIGAFVVIGDDVIIGDNTSIYPHVVIYSGAKIGVHAVIHAGAIIREFVEIGAHCVIQNGAVIGSDGFGYIPDPKIGHKHIPHVGYTVLKDRVDVGANTTIDRATLGSTMIGENVKIDNLVMIGHNVQVGKNTILCAQVGISGSCTIGEDVIFGGQAGIGGHLKVGDRVKAGGKTGIIQNVESDQEIAGWPSVEVKTWLRNMALLVRLNQVLKDRNPLTSKSKKPS